MPVAAWISLASLAVLGLAQLGAIIVWGAILTQRVKTLEQDAKSRTDLKPEMAALTATVAGIDKRLSELKADNHEAFAEINHILRNRLMAIAPSPRTP